VSQGFSTSQPSICNSYNDFILKEATDDLSESQPTAGNIAGIKKNDMKPQKSLI